MKATLQRVQRSWFQAVLDPQVDVPRGAAACIGGVRRGAAGFAIYAGAVRETLMHSLGLRFPATKVLLGRPAFKRAVCAYLCHSPPRSSDLSIYGEGFAQYAAGQASVRRKEVVMEVARYEWTRAELARTGQMHAVACSPPAVVESAVPQVQLRLARNARPWSSPLPVQDWIEQALSNTTFPDQRPQRLLLVASAEIKVLELQPAEYTFVMALAEGAPLVAAASAALRVDENFQVQPFLERLLAAGALETSGQVAQATPVRVPN